MSSDARPLSSPHLAAPPRDLEFVLPSPARTPLPTHGPIAHIEPAIIARVAAWVRAAKAPAVVGLSTLSIEACREAIAFAELARARLLPWPQPGDRLADPASVVQTASLGHIFQSQLIIWVGCHGKTDAIAREIASHQLLAAFVAPELEPVLRLRRLLAADPAAEPLGRHQRVGVVLGAGVDARVASQWHKLAAQMQERVRVAVVSLPDLASAGNLRGAVEAITWQTGQSCARGGVDFADGGPRPCPDAQTLLARGAIDLVIDTAPTSAPLTARVARRVVVGRPLEKAASASLVADETIHVPTPALGEFFAARVMRFDGVILWTVNDPAAAPPDPAAGFFRDLASALRGGA